MGNNFKLLASMIFKMTDVHGRSNRIVLGVLIVMLFIGGIYWFSVNEKEKYLVQRNFRLLNLWSEEVTNKIESYRKVSELAFKEIGDENLVSFQHTPMPSCSEKNIEDFSKLGYFGYIRLAHKRLCRAGLRNITIEKAEAEAEAEKYSAKLVKKDNNLLLQINYSNGKFTLRGDLQFSEFLIGLANERVFEDILLIEENIKIDKAGENSTRHNTIIFQKNAKEYSWRNWDNLIKRINNDSWLNFFERSPSQQKDSTRNTLANAPHIINFQSPHGNGYAVFTQPVRFSSKTISTDKKLEHKLYIAGIVSTEKLRQSYLAVSSTTLLVIMATLLGLVLSIPLIRLVMMGPTDALKSLHICILFFSMSLCTGLLVILFLDISIFESGKVIINKQMEQTADNIKKQMQTELTQVLRTLKRYDQEKKYSEESDSLRESQEKSLFYHDSSLTFWMDKQGDLQENWKIQSGKRRPEYKKGSIHLMERKYVSTVLETPQNLWHTHWQDHPNTHNTHKNVNFFVEPIVSWSTGIDKVVASIPSSKGGWVAALQFKFLSLMQEVVIPPGVGFAVIDNKNYQVLFHSRKSRGMRENFLIETDDNPLVRDLVRVNESRHVDGRYWGVNTHFYVMSFDEVPWALVVYREKELLASVSLVMLALAGGIFTAWTLLFLFGIPGLIGWIFRFDYFKSKRWLWPDQRYHAYYQNMFILNGIFFLLGLSAYRIWGNSHGELLIITLIIYPLVILITNLLALKYYKEDIQLPNTIFLKALSYPTSYGLMLSSFLFVFSALPAVGIMNIVYQKEMTTVVKHQLFKLHQALSETDKPLVSFKSTVDLEERGITQIKNKNNTSDQESKSDTCFTQDNSEKVTADNAEKTGLWGFYPNFFLDSKWSIAPECIEKDNAQVSELNVTNFDILYQEMSRHFIPLKKGIEGWGLIKDSQDGSHIKWAADDSKITLHGNLRARKVDSAEPKYPQEIWPDTWKNYTISGSADLSFRPWIFGGEWVNIQDNWPRFILYVFLLIIFLGLIYKVPLFIANKTLFLFRPRRSNTELPPNILEKLFSNNAPNLLIIGYPGQGKTQKINQLTNIPGNNNDRNIEQILIRLNMKNTPDCEWLSFITQQESDQKKNNDKWKENTQGKPDSIIIIDQFEFRCNEPAINQKKLVLLETLLFPTTTDDSRRHIHIISNGYPGVFPMNAESINAETFERDEFSARWNTLWEAFGLMYYAMNHLESEQSRHDKWLENEIHSIQFLPKVRDKIRGDFLRPHYQAIWQSITLDEQLALFHLARDRFIHSKHPGLNSLLCKGLIKFDPDLHLMDKRFDAFVRYVGKRDQLQLIENKHKNSRWGIIKVPLGVGFLVFFMFLAITQEEFRLIFPALISILPVLFQGMPDLFNGTSKTPSADTEKSA